VTLSCPRLFGTEVRPARLSRVPGWVHVGEGLAVHVLDLFDDPAHSPLPIRWFFVEVAS